MLPPGGRPVARDAVGTGVACGVGPRRIPMHDLPLALLTGERLGTAGPDLGRYLAVVGTLVAVLVGVAWALRRILAGSLRGRAARRALAVVDVLPLGGRRQLTVVRCYDRTFALGLGDREVSLIAELDAAAVPAPAERDRAIGREIADFERLVGAAKERLRRRARAGEPSTPRPDARELVG